MNVEWGEMDQQYKGEIELCDSFLDLLPLINLEIEKRTSLGWDCWEKASFYNALPHPTSDCFLVILDGGDLKETQTDGHIIMIVIWVFLIIEQ